MKSDLWSAIQSVFDVLKATQRTAATATEPGSSPSPEALNDLMQIRNNLRTELHSLKAVLGESLSERDVYLVLFPITVYLDEAVQTEVFQISEKQWPLLQKELFEVEDGGQLFYDTLDDALQHPETLPLIHEVFFLCLNSGFKGKHGDNPSRITAYKQMLKNKIPSADPGEAEDAGTSAPPLKVPRSPLWYYVAAAAALIVVFLLLLYWGKQ